MVQASKHFGAIGSHTLHNCIVNSIPIEFEGRYWTLSYPFQGKRPKSTKDTRETGFTPYPWSKYEVYKDGAVRNMVVVKPIRKGNVSSIRSCSRRITCSANAASILRTNPTLRSQSSNGAKSTIAFHRLMALTFVINDDVEHKIQVNHIDGNRFNNLPDNLEWVTASQNQIHRFYVLGGLSRCAQIDDRGNQRWDYQIGYGVGVG